MKWTPRLSEAVVSNFQFEFTDAGIRLFPSKFIRRYRVTFTRQDYGTDCNIELVQNHRTARYSGGSCTNQHVEEPWPFYEIKVAFNKALVRSLYPLPIRQQGWKALRNEIKKHKEEAGK